MTYRLSALPAYAAAVCLAVALGVCGAPDAHAQMNGMNGAADTVRISFDEAVRTALDQNTDLKRAANQVDAADATIWAERMDFAPRMDVSLGAQRTFGRSFSPQEGDVVDQSTDFLTGDLNGSLTVFDGFSNVASLRRANEQGLAREFDLQRTQQDVVFRVMNEYINLVENREILRVQQEELDAREQQLAQIQEFVDAGSRPISALYEQQAAVAEQESAILRAERDIQLAETRLIQVLQLDPLQPYNFQAPSIPQDTLVGEEQYDLNSLLQQAVDRRLDLKAARADVRAADHDVTVARSGYFPTISLGASWGSDWSTRARDEENIEGTGSGPAVVTIPTTSGETVPYIVPGTEVDPQTRPISFLQQLDNRRGGSFSISLNFPIFDGLRRDQQVEQAQVQQLDAEYALQDQKLQVSLQVREAYLNYRNAAQQLDATAKRLRAARQAREAAQERYNLGAASIVELTNANRTFVEAASQRIRARYTFVFQEKLIEYFVGTLNPQTDLFR